MSVSIATAPAHVSVARRGAKQRRGAIVMCASIPWSFHRNRQQELAERLSEFMPVLYVEPPRRRRHRAATRLWAVKQDCHVLSSPSGLPGERIVSPINRLVQRGLARAIARALETRGLTCAVLWVDRIQSAALLDCFPQSFVVYDCVDEEWTFGRLRRRRYLEKLESIVARRADATLASSSKLYRRLSSTARHVELVPNACDFAHFSCEAHAADRPPDLPSPGRPLIGFTCGVFRRALDYRLLRHVFAHLEGSQFVFVGAFDTASERLIASVPNASLVGAKDYSLIPSYLRSFDAAIIPYAVGGSIDYVYPKKLHEYLAAGKPVVATDLPELRPFERVVKIARSPEQFVRSIEECLRENADPALSARLIAQRQAVARQNTWEDRVRQIVAVLETGLRTRSSHPAPQQRDERHA